MFVNNFVTEQRWKRSSSSLLNIEQGENESLRTFISHFNREALLVVEMDDKILLAAFYNGVSSDFFIHKLYDQESQTMADLIHSTQSFMNAEDAIIAKKAKIGEKKDHDRKKVGSSSRRYSNYTPLNTLLNQVLMQIKDDPSLKWPEMMKGDPSKRNKSKYCCFHRDHGHDIDQYYDLKQQIEDLIK